MNRDLNFKKQLLNFVSEWLIPRGYLRLISQYVNNIRRIDEITQKELKRNISFKDVHSSKRCFILGTGPSIGDQNLYNLRTEHCISVNSFYLHKDYLKIKPKYHIVSGLALHRHIPWNIGYKWYKEIEERTDNSILFLNYKDYKFVQEKKLFSRREIYYLLFDNSWGRFSIDGIDATKMLYLSQSVSIMALQLAFYMGFRETVLLGMDHDWILRMAEKKYNHFYSPSQSILEKSGVTDWDGCDWSSELYSQYMLWQQYKILKDYAEKNLKAKIINATKGGLLDVFERIEFEKLFKQSSKSNDTKYERYHSTVKK